MEPHANPTSNHRASHDILLQLQAHLNENENRRREVVDEVISTVGDRFKNLQELREKVRIENEKQRLLLGVLEKLKFEEEDENENEEQGFMLTQVEILRQFLAVKKEEKILKHAILNEKKNQVSQLEEKLLAYQDVISVQTTETNLMIPSPVQVTLNPTKHKPAKHPKTLKANGLVKTKIDDEFFSELL